MPAAIEAGAFRLAAARAASPLTGALPARETFRVDAWQREGHQREAAVTSLATGEAWRVVSDEGLHLRGHDLAPYPFQYVNAGTQADLLQRLVGGATARGFALDRLAVAIDNFYGLTGSFADGSARGDSDPAQIEICLDGGLATAEVAALVAEALAVSPLIALLRTPVNCTLAVYAHGRRQAVPAAIASPAADAHDPDRVYEGGPRASNAAASVIWRSDEREPGTPEIAAAGAATRLVRTVRGRGSVDRDGHGELETWLAFPGASHFRYRAGSDAPGGLALAAAGLAFCYMTQLSRHIEHRPSMAAFKRARGARVVQYLACAVEHATDGTATGAIEAIDTHVFLDADAHDAQHVELASAAAATCFLRNTAAATIPPVVRIVHNGRPLA